jgi:4-amino-4-deoxy-L-arabinose transferase-like glycosyltransferase
LRFPDFNTTRQWWTLYALCALSFLPALNVYFVGEEPIVVITSFEMWHRGDLLTHTIYGLNAMHNPLFNWLHIPLASAVGWEHGLAAARLLMMVSTVLAGLVLAWLARELFRDRTFAAFSAVVFITLSDLFVYRGWLAYSDPMFMFFVFSGIASLWMACQRRSPALLGVAAVAITAGFMLKAMTAYTFYAGAGLILLFRKDYRDLLLSPASLVIHALMIAWPVIWFLLVLDGGGQGSRMLGELLDKWWGKSFGAYLVKLISYLAETLVSLSPGFALAAYFLWRRRGGALQPDSHSAYVYIALAIALLNFMPYWLAPQSHARYLLPLYPLFGLVIARTIWRAGPSAVRTSAAWFVGFLAFKLVFLLAAFPYYQQTYRGANYLEAAREIYQTTRGFPVYATDVTATGLSVVAHLDVLLLPDGPVIWPPREIDSGFVVSDRPKPSLGPVVKTWRLGANQLYLICTGQACDKWEQRQSPQSGAR